MITCLLTKFMHILHTITIITSTNKFLGNSVQYTVNNHNQLATKLYSYTIFVAILYI